MQNINIAVRRETGILKIPHTTQTDFESPLTANNDAMLTIKEYIP